MLWQIGLDPDAGADGASPLACNIIGALIGAAASIGGSLIGASAANKSAKAQEASARINRNASQQVGQLVDEGYQRTLSDALNELNFGEYRAQAPLQPYQQAGTESLNRLMGALGLPGGEQTPGGLNELLASTPGYQFRMDQGTQALNRAANAGGNLYSGGTGKALVGYGQGLASDYWGQYLNELAGVTGMGQQAASQGSNVAANFGGSRANALLGTQNNRANAAMGSLNAYTGANAQIGAAQAGGAINSANAWTNGLNNLGQIAGTYFGGKSAAPSGFNPNTIGAIY